MYKIRILEESEISRSKEAGGPRNLPKKTPKAVRRRRQKLARRRNRDAYSGQ